ncbi:MAG TPA: hypothetical protein VLJ15_03395 [Gammaproteobacteria bacterium]|nr:hypothetical protein [Gammaproteobacteria bacterium]
MRARPTKQELRETLRINTQRIETLAEEVKAIPGLENYRDDDNDRVRRARDRISAHDRTLIDDDPKAKAEKNIRKEDKAVTTGSLVYLQQHYTFMRTFGTYISRIPNLNNSRSLAMLSACAIAGEQYVHDQMQEQIDESFPGYKLNVFYTRQLSELAKQKFKELAPAHIIGRIDQLTDIQLQELLREEDPNEIREKIDALRGTLKIRLTDAHDHRHDEAIISNDAAREIFQAARRIAENRQAHAAAAVPAAPVPAAVVPAAVVAPVHAPAAINNPNPQPIKQILKERLEAKKQQMEGLKRIVEGEIPGLAYAENKETGDALDRINAHIRNLDDNPAQEADQATQDDNAIVTNDLDFLIKHYTFMRTVGNNFAQLADLNTKDDLVMFNLLALNPEDLRQRMEAYGRDIHPGYALSMEHFNQLATLGQLKFKELAPTHIINNLPRLSDDQLKQLLAADKIEKRREKIHELLPVLEINLQGHTADQTIISDVDAGRIRNATEALAGERFRPGMVTAISNANITAPNGAKMLAELAMATTNRPATRAAVKKYKQPLGIGDIRDSIITNRTNFFPDAKATDALPEAAIGRLHDQIRNIIPTIAGTLDLQGGAGEIKKITDLAIADEDWEDNVREQITPLKSRLGDLKNFEEKQLESAHVVSDNNALGIQASVRTKLQGLVQQMCETKITEKRDADLFTLGEFVNIHSTNIRGIRNFIAADANRKFFGLDNFEREALENPAVISNNNAAAIHLAAVSNFISLRDHVINTAKHAISTATNINTRADALALADLAVAVDVRASVVTHKAHIGMGNIHDPAIREVRIFPDGLMDTLQQEARARIQAEITKTVSAKIKGLTSPTDDLLLNALATGTTHEAIRAVIADHKTKLGLDHLDADRHIKQNAVITLGVGSMVEGFKNLAIARRIDQSSEGRIVLGALANLQAEFNSTAMTPEYQNLRNTFWNNNPVHKEAFLAFAKEFSKTDDEATRTTNLTALLRPLFDSSSTLSEMDTQNRMVPLTLGSGNLATAIYKARIAEAQAQKIKNHVEELTERHKEIQKTYTKAQELQTEAKKAAGAIKPATSPEAKQKENEANKVETVVTELKNQLDAAEDAMNQASEARERLYKGLLPTATGVTRPQLSAADALTLSQAALDRKPNAVDLAIEEFKNAKAAHSIAIAQPRAPKLEAIPDETIQGEGRQLTLCRIVETSYSRMTAFITAAESGDTRALDDLDAMINEATTLNTRIGEARAAINTHSSTSHKTKAKTDAWLENAGRNLESLKVELEFLKTKKAEFLDTRIRVLRYENESFTQQQLKEMNTDSAGHDTWLRNIETRAPANAAPLFHARHNGRDAALFTDAADRDALVSYRHYPPGAPTYDHSISFEKETRATPGSLDVTYELIGKDLAIGSSDKGALVDFLDKKGVANARELVFTNDKLHPVLTKEAVQSFLAAAPIGMTDPGVANQFMQNHLKQYRTQKITLPDQFENKTNSKDKISLDQYLDLPFEERKQYKDITHAPWRPSRITTFFKGQETEMIPKEAVFAEAARMLVQAASKNKLPLEFISFNDKELLIAMSYFAKVEKLDIKFPEAATQITDNQVKAASFMNYQAMYSQPKKVTKGVEQAAGKMDTEIKSYKP